MTIHDIVTGYWLILPFRAGIMCKSVWSVLFSVLTFFLICTGDDIFLGGGLNSVNAFCYLWKCFVCRVHWLIQAFKICLSAMGLHRRRQGARYNDDLRKTKNASGGRSAKNWRLRKVSKTSAVHPPGRSSLEKQTSVPRSRDLMLGLKNWTTNLKK